MNAYDTRPPRAAAGLPASVAVAGPAAAPAGIAALTLLMVGSLVVMATAVIAPGLPALEAHFAGDPRVAYLVPLVLTMPALVIAVAAPLAGYVLDRFERKPIVLAALVGFVGFGTAGALAGSPEVLLATRAALGLAVAFLMSGFSAMVGDLFSPAARGAFIGRQVGANSMISLVMILAGGALAELSWRGAFVVYAFAAPLVLMFAVLVPRVPRDLAATNAGQAAGGQGALAAIAGAYALAVLCPLFFFILPTQSPFLIRNAYGGSAGLIAVAIGVATIAVLPASLLFARLRQSLSPWTVFALGFGVLGAGFLVQGLAPSLAWLVAGMGVSGFGFGLVMPNLSTTVLTLAPAHLRGRLSGGLVSAIFIGQFLSPLVSHPLVLVGGYQNTFLVSAGLLAAIAAAALVPVLRARASTR